MESIGRITTRVSKQALAVFRERYAKEADGPLPAWAASRLTVIGEALLVVELGKALKGVFPDLHDRIREAAASGYDDVWISLKDGQGEYISFLLRYLSLLGYQSEVTQLEMVRISWGVDVVKGVNQ